MLKCSIVSDKEVTARLINNEAFIFDPTPERKITAAQMKEYLKDSPDLSEVAGKIGKANVEIKYSNSTGYDYYYELESKNGEPRYAHITTNGNYGKCLNASLCSERKPLGKDEDATLLKWQKPKDN